MGRKEHYKITNFLNICETNVCETDLLFIQNNLKANQTFSLFSSRNISTNSILDSAKKKVHNDANIETFVPLYISNYCDSICKICNMNLNNPNFIRKNGGPKEIYKQLQIIKDTEGISAICILTGEYSSEISRFNNLFKVGWTIQTALNMGFKKVYFNIGSLTKIEIDYLKEWINTDDPVVLSLFQETYNESIYEKHFGFCSTNIPKSCFFQRLHTADNWLDAGFREIDIGILLGLTDVAFDLSLLIDHANHLINRGGDIKISIPRIYCLKNNHELNISDETFMRSMAVLAFSLPNSKLIITTRESEELIHKLLPIVGIVSPGSSDVLPYSKEGCIPNNPNTSQFFVNHERARPASILNNILKKGIKIRYFNY